MVFLILSAILQGQAPIAPYRDLNVVFILADDLGWRDLSGEGSTFYESPHIDRIAEEGMRFTQGYAASQVCSPSRAAIMTGKYPARVGITDWIGAAEGTDWKRNTRLLPPHYTHALPHGDVTLAEAFKEASYRTFFAGKWHLGGRGSYPEDHGFEINIGGHERGSPFGGYFSPYKNPKMKDGPEDESLPMRLGRETSHFIEQHREERFFVFLSFYSVHSPLQTSKELWSKYRRKAVAQPPPHERFVIDRTLPVRQVQDHPVYGGMVEAMDDAVGLVLSTLDRLNLSDRTVVIFTSDNGGVSSGDADATSNLPLRGGKGRQWEGGLREPYYIKWPGVVTEGSTSDVPVTGTDFYPTLLEIAGLPARPAQHVDGVSLVPLLRSQSIEPRPLYWHYPHYGNQGGEPSSIIRQGDWKLIHYYEDGRNELYDLRVDPRESKDVSSQHPEDAQALERRLRAWLTSVDARTPSPNPRFDEKEYVAQQEKLRITELPNLERAHAAFLGEDWAPPQGWWRLQDRH